MPFYHLIAQTSSSTNNANIIANGIAVLIFIVLIILFLGVCIFSLYWLCDYIERHDKWGVTFFGLLITGVFLLPFYSFFAPLIFLVFIALFLGVYIWSIYQLYNYAERRGKCGCIVVLIMILCGWPANFFLLLLLFADDSKK